MKTNTAAKGGCEFCPSDDQRPATRTCLICGERGCDEHIIDKLCEFCDDEVESAYLDWEEETEKEEWH